MRVCTYNGVCNGQSAGGCRHKLCMACGQGLGRSRSGHGGSEGGRGRMRERRTGNVPRGS
eukprot:767348-Hanusia_phi.AAC.3